MPYAPYSSTCGAIIFLAIAIPAAKQPRKVSTSSCAIFPFPLVCTDVDAPAATAAELANRFPRSRAPLAVAALGLVVAMGVGTRAQLAHWRDTEALFSRAIAVAPDNYYAEQGLADAMGADLITDESAWDTIRAFFAARGREPAPNNRVQAIAPIFVRRSASQVAGGRSVARVEREAARCEEDAGRLRRARKRDRPPTHR